MRLNVRFYARVVMLMVFHLIGPADSMPIAQAETQVPSGSLSRRCTIFDMASLRACFSKADEYDVFFFDADVTCGSGNACCPGDKEPSLQLVNVKGKRIEGNGHTFRRASGQARCPAIKLQAVQDVLVDRLNLDENEQVPPCDLSTHDCASTLRVQSSRNIKLTDVNIYFGKGYVVYVWDTDGFAFVRSSISDAGIIGLYVGHYRYGPSKNIVVIDSVIAGSRANGLALQGAISNDGADPVLVSGNVLSRNHWHGLWPVPGVPNGITSGGQILVANGRNIRVSNNIVADGGCENCNPTRQTVTAVEIAEQAPPPAGVAGLTIDHNTFLNGAATAIRQNPDTFVTGVTIADNRLTGFAALDSVTSPATRSDNILGPAQDLAKTKAVTYRAMSLSQSGTHTVTRDPDGTPNAKAETTFALSPFPRPGALPGPIFQCRRSGGQRGDYATRSKVCDGKGELIAILGYSYEPDYPHARPFYNCKDPRSEADSFVSWDSQCEGRELVGPLGFATDGRSNRP